MIYHFKQAWNLFRQEKLFSSIYVIGTGLSISLVMILSIVYYIRIANIYPEINRDRTLVVKSGGEIYENGRSYGPISMKVVETCFQSLQTAEAVTAIMDSWWDDKQFVQLENSNAQVPVMAKYVDNVFWQVFSFRFLDGKPFSTEEFQSGIQTAVISESLARKIFGTINAVGKFVSLDFVPYRVSGIVKDVSFVTEVTYAQLWIPYTVRPDWNEQWDGGCLGKMKCYVLAPSVRDIDKVRKEALENIRRYDQSLGENLEFTTFGQPDCYWQSTFRFFSGAEPDFNKILIKYSVVFFVLLLVPAVSLSGLADSRMDRRLAEMGVRRAFGAPVQSLMRQILSENLMFTLLGGGIGLVFSYLFVFFASDWIMQLGKGFLMTAPEEFPIVFTSSMLINFPVFLIALGVCFLLNLMTALIPAWKASHKEIVTSLNPKE